MDRSCARPALLPRIAADGNVIAAAVCAGRIRRMRTGTCLPETTANWSAPAWRRSSTSTALLSAPLRLCARSCAAVSGRGSNFWRHASPAQQFRAGRSTPSMGDPRTTAEGGMLSRRGASGEHVGREHADPWLRRVTACHASSVPDRIAREPTIPVPGESGRCGRPRGMRRRRIGTGMYTNV